MQIQKILIMTFIVVCIGLCGSCSSKNKIARPLTYYTLHYETPEPSGVAALPVTLSIEKLRANPPYHTQRIIYSTSAYSQNKYYYHQWITTPDEMVTQLLVRDLIASGRFHAVMLSAPGSATHQLKGTIDELYEQDTDDLWNAVLSITILLIDNSEKDETARVCFQKNYQKTYPCEQRNPKSLARALSLALSEISDQIGNDLYHAVSKSE